MVTLISTLHPGNIMHYEDIWNVTVTVAPVNTSAYYFVEVTVADDKNITLWKANTYTFRITSSPLTITPPSLPLFEPVSVVFTEPSWYEKMSNTGGMFSPGKYYFTYRLIETTEGCTTAGKLIADAFVEKEITTLFPPTLLFPFNHDTIKTTTPVFTWLLAMPVTEAIHYTILVSEINGFQNPVQALTNNRSYLKFDAGTKTMITYPPSAFPLHEGNRYAWQVVASSSTGITGYSDVWSFTMAETTPPPPSGIIPSVFMVLSHDPISPYYTTDTTFIAFEYEEFYTDSDTWLNYYVRHDQSGKIIAEGTILPQRVSKGRNIYSFDISGFRTGMYSVEIVNEKNIKRYLRFRTTGKR